MQEKLFNKSIRKEEGPEQEYPEIDSGHVRPY